MGQIIWSPGAWHDVEAIAEYIAQDSIAQASLFARKLIEATDRLAEFPFSGKITPEIGEKDRREIRVGNYRIMYSIVGDGVLVTRVFHGARNFKR